MSVACREESIYLYYFLLGTCCDYDRSWWIPDEGGILAWTGNMRYTTITQCWCAAVELFCTASLHDRWQRGKSNIKAERTQRKLSFQLTAHSRKVCWIVFGFFQAQYSVSCQNPNQKRHAVWGIPARSFGKLPFKKKKNTHNTCKTEEKKKSICADQLSTKSTAN